jgi:hypothetical protein
MYGGGASPRGSRTSPGRGSVRLVDVLIAGAQKSGTSTLAAALERLPAVVAHRTDPEFPFFSEDHRYAAGYTAAFERYYGRDVPDGLVLAKSAGVMFLERAVTRAAEHNPDLKVIVILREPVARAYSAYHYFRRQGREQEASFEAALARESERLSLGQHLLAYRGRGDYLPQVRRLHEVLGVDRVRVLLLEDLQEDEEAVTRSLAGWLGLDVPPVLGRLERVNASSAARNHRFSTLLHDPDTPIARVGRALPVRLRRGIVTRLEALNARPPSQTPMLASTRDELREWFAPRNEALAQYLGRDLTRWASP